MATKTNLKASLPKPPGFDSEENTISETTTVISAEVRAAAIQKQVISVSYAPGKALFQTAFMLWMSGSSVQIFSIMMTGMALINPVKAIVNTNQAFKVFAKESVDLKLPKVIYVSLQILSLAVALYKKYTMGLLPVTSGDWTSYIPPKSYAETSSYPL